MESLRTIVPVVALVLGIAVGWRWGASEAVEPPPPLPPEPCPASPVTEELQALELDVALLRAEQEEGW